ncbi:WXG100 family type VII secretion target [Corynebacterium mayonis]|uniref:WXG100 family type VII secretion target n=1 Tax=Corynebacterium mayonis TaxID=3062461 RepID=UPI00313FE6A2
MGQFKTEADVMRSAAERVDETNSNVQIEADRVQQVAESTRAFWSGQAQRSFDELMVRYDDAQRRLAEALGAIASNIRDNARHFEDTDAANTSDITSVGAGLPL